MNAATPSLLDTRSPAGRYLIYSLLLLAATHCVLSNFYVNVSYLNLAAYERGEERNPYQERVAMALLLREAHNSSSLQTFASGIRDKLAAHPRSAFKAISSEELASMLAGLVSVYLVTAFTVWYGQRKFPQLWWIPPVVLLGMLYVTQSARYEAAIWFPYDLPQMALFGAASISILEGWWPAAFVLFLIDIPIRETSIYLASITATTALSRQQWKYAIVLPSAMFVCWVAFYMLIYHIFAHNPNRLNLDLSSKRQDLLNPLHWPQVASAFGFMLIPLISGRRYLSREQRFFLIGALPCFVVTMVFAIWHETRVFCEWIVPAAVLVTAEFSAFISSQGLAVFKKMP